MHFMKKKTLRAQIILVFFWVVVPFLLISILISSYSVKVSNERLANSYAALLDMLQRDVENDLTLIDANMRLQFTSNDTLFLRFASANNQSDSAFFRTNLYQELQKNARSFSVLHSFFMFAPTYYPATLLMTNTGTASTQNADALKSVIAQAIQNSDERFTNNGSWFVLSVGKDVYFAKVYCYNDVYMGALVNSATYLSRLEYSALNGTLTISSKSDDQTSKSQFKRILAVFDDCCLCLTLDKTNVFQQMPTTLKWMIAGLILLTIIVFLLLKYLIQDILNPFRELTTNIELIRQGNLSIRLPENSGYYELALLHRRFNEMLKEIHDLKIDNYEHALKWRSLELQCRQLEINPHFFIGTLNTIHALISYKRYSVVTELLTEMISYVRSVLADHGNTILLKEEIDRVNSFLRMQHLRFDRTILCDINVAPELLEALVPPMILLTFVENTIKHNAVQHKSLVIQINIELKAEEQILITILDNGEGFCPEIIDRINRGEKLIYQGISHIGIYNVFARLSLLYDNGKGWLRISNDESGGACVQIGLPAQMKGAKNHEAFDC